MIPLWARMRERLASRHTFALFSIYLLGIASIIRANRSYLDDVGRSLYGYSDWVASARPLADLCAWFFYMGPRTVDASPLTQIIAVAFLAATSLLLLDALKVRLTWPAVLCTVPVGLAPYGLENLSYKFDAPYMALALLFCILAVCFVRSRSRIDLLISSVCIFCSASLYQPALGAYLTVACYIAIVELASRRSLRCTATRVLRLLLPFIIGVGVYTVQAPFWIYRSQYADYVAQHSTLLPPERLIPGLIEHINLYISLLIKDWGRNGLGLLMAVLVLLFIVQIVTRWSASVRKLGHAPQGYLRLILLAVLLPCLILAPFGVQFALINPVWTPRTFLAFGILIAIMLLNLYGFAKSRVPVIAARAVMALLVLQLLVFANVYGNLLDAQNQWELSRLSLLSRDLNQYIKETGSSSFSFVGSMGLSPLAVTPARKYPLLERLVTVPLTRDWRWGYEQLNTFGVQVQRRPLPEGIEHMTLTPFLESPSYRIQRAPGDFGIVTFLPPPVPKSPRARNLPPRPPVQAPRSRAEGNI